MSKYKVGDLVFCPSKGQTKYNQENDQLFVITRFFNENQIIIGSLNHKEYQIKSEYIVELKYIKKYIGKTNEEIKAKLVKNGFMSQKGEAYIFDHSLDSLKGYLPILGINYQVAHFK